VIRFDHQVIGQWIKPKSRILDLGCGDGQLMKYLQYEYHVSGYGVEIEIERVTKAIANGVNVIQRDLESGLAGIAEQSFDTVILSQTLQAMRQTEFLLSDMLRVGREGIVTFPNFGYWKNRWQVMKGIMPKSEDLPYEWHNTPNIHLCTLQDFEDLCRHLNIKVIERHVISHGKTVHFAPNLLGSLAMYRVTKLI
jgi:methionine biosynthesis protein MetW